MVDDAAGSGDAQRPPPARGGGPGTVGVGAAGSGCRWLGVGRLRDRGPARVRPRWAALPRRRCGSRPALAALRRSAGSWPGRLRSGRPSGLGPVRPPLWWLPNEHGGSPVWGDGDRAPVRIPDRLLRRAAGRVPGGSDRQPGSAGVAMSGEVGAGAAHPGRAVLRSDEGCRQQADPAATSGRRRRPQMDVAGRPVAVRPLRVRAGQGGPGIGRTGRFGAERPGRFTRGGGSAGATAGGRRNPPFRRPRRPPIIGFHDAEVRRRCSPGGSRSGSRGRSGSLEARGAGSIAGNSRKPVWAVDRVGHAPNRIGCAPGRIGRAPGRIGRASGRMAGASGRIGGPRGDWAYSHSGGNPRLGTGHGAPRRAGAERRDDPPCVVRAPGATLAGDEAGAGRTASGYRRDPTRDRPTVIPAVVSISYPPVLIHQAFIHQAFCGATDRRLVIRRPASGNAARRRSTAGAAR